MILLAFGISSFVLEQAVNITGQGQVESGGESGGGRVNEPEPQDLGRVAVEKQADRSVDVPVPTEGRDSSFPLAPVMRQRVLLRAAIRAVACLVDQPLPQHVAHPERSLGVQTENFAPSSFVGATALRSQMDALPRCVEPVFHGAPPINLFKNVLRPPQAGSRLM